MGPIQLKVLEAEIQAQRATIEDIYMEVEARAARLQSGDLALLESLGYQLHNLYNAVEDLFKIVAGAFENSVADASHWYIELVRRMRLEIEGVRPALVSKELYPVLDELRGFRHFFRHAYIVRLDEERVRSVLAHARRARPLLERDVAQFLGRLGSLP